MADKVKIKLNHASIGSILKGSEIQANLGARAARIAAAATANAGNGAVFGHGVTVGANRARAGVWTQNAEAMVAEARHRALTRAVDAGRG